MGMDNMKLHLISQKSCRLCDCGYNNDGNPIRIHDISDFDPTLLGRSRFKIRMSLKCIEA